MIAPANRFELGQWLNSIGLIGDSVEVGTHRGDFANHLLKTWRGRKLWCVDCWSELPHDHLLYREQPTNEAQEKFFNDAKSLLAVHGERVGFVRKFSADAARGFANRSLDFIYIDAGHDQASVSCDLLAWWPKLKEGGVFCGDDYFEPYPGVIAAVDNFAAAVGRVLLSQCGNCERPQWYLRR